MYDFEINKKNNLIFYGIGREERENGRTLLLKAGWRIVKLKYSV